MNIILEGPKVLKPTSPDSGFTLLDATMNFGGKPRSDYGFEITGSGTRNLVINGLWGTINAPALLEWSQLIKYAGTASIIRFVNCRYFKVVSKGYEIYGSGNNQSQPIMIGPDCKGWEFDGGYINQGRNNQPIGTSGGACFQAESAKSSALNASNWSAEYCIHRNMVLENCCDEGFYLFYNNGSGTPKPSGSEYALIENCRVVNVGRDPFQGRGIKRFEIINNYAENWGLETEKNHISGISWNSENPSGLIKGNTFKTGPQFIYAGTEGVYTKVDIEDNFYDQGNHAGVRANSACYMVGPGLYTFKRNIINAPKALKGVISVDRCTVEHDGTNQLIGIKPFVMYTGGIVNELNPPPVTVITKQDLEVQTRTDYQGNVSVRYFAILNGIKTELKP